MGYTSDQQLSAMGLKPLAHIPNRAGARITLRTRNGDDIDATIDVITVDRCGGTDTVLDYVGDYEYEDFIGWKAVPDADNTLVKFKAGPDVIDAHLSARRARIKI